MINVKRVLGSPNFRQQYEVRRKSGTWVNGVFVEAETSMMLSGAVIPASPKDLKQVPEGDRVTGAMAFYSLHPLKITRESGTSDIAVWRGELYRLLTVFPYIDYGYYKAIGVRMVGD